MVDKNLIPLNSRNFTQGYFSIFFCKIDNEDTSMSNQKNVVNSCGC